MDMTRYVNTFGKYLRERYGEKVHKLSLNAVRSCPNRDGTKGIGGCIFCNNESFSPGSSKKTDQSIKLQIAKGRQEVQERTGAKKFLGYFQSYSNTYGDLSYLKQVWDTTLSEPDMVGLSIGTRPDCLPEEVLDILGQYQQKGYEIWLELGLQSSNDATLARINRGHTFADYVDGVTRARKHGLKVCTHLIMGLPGEKPSDILTSFRQALGYGLDAVKIHPLHIVKGTQLARQWKHGEVQELTMEEYTDNLVKIIQLAPKDLVFHRLTGSGERDYLLAPDWVMHKWLVLNNLYKKLGNDCLTYN
ncbi:Biotin synthase [invertebrate metagenome]|uniref:Biotin synthase n=1 Tax=invertebrate metagenome TaxID=1711999 RepID=A0A2H9T4C1_9ZZZZ